MRNLAAYMRRLIPPEVTSQNFHDYLLRHLAERGESMAVPPPRPEESRFYDETLPTKGLDYFCNAPDEDKFDSVIVDEGQDFESTWYVCLESMLRHTHQRMAADGLQGGGRQRRPIRHHRVIQRARG
jgi:hypothetical protein